MGALLLCCAEARISQSAVVERGADIVGGNNVTLDGTISGNTRIWGDDVSIAGTIQGDLEVHAKKIDIYPPAVITGEFSYATPTEDALVIHPGVSLTGEPTWMPPRTEKEQAKSAVSFPDFVFSMSKMLAAFFFGIIVIWLFRKYAQSTIEQLQHRFSAAVAAGFLSVFVVAMSALILLISAVCAIAGAIFIQGNLAPVGALILILSLLLVPITTFITVAGGVLFYSGKIFVAILCGYLLIRLVKKEPVALSKTQLLLGLIVLTLLSLIPYVGVVIYILASVIGVGAIVLGVRGCRKELESPSPITGTTPTGGSASAAPPDS